MARSLIVRNLDDELVRRLKLRAARYGRSAEAEHRAILQDALAAEPTGSLKDVAAWRSSGLSTSRRRACQRTLEEGEASSALKKPN